MGRLKTFALIEGFRGLNTKQTPMLLPQGKSPNLQNVSFPELGVIAKRAGSARYNSAANVIGRYSAGTVAVTKNSATVTGTDTLWAANVSTTDRFRVDADGTFYEIKSVDSDTQLILKTTYKGDSGSGLAYTISSPICGIYRGYLPGGIRRLLVASNTSLYKGDDTAKTFSSFKEGLTYNQDTEFETFPGANIWIIANRADAPLKYDDTTCALLGGSPPTASGYPTFHKNRLWLFKASKGYFCNLGDPEIWGANDWIEFKTGDGDIVTGAMSVGDILIVFKQNSFFVVFGSSPDNFRVEGPLFSVGAVTNRGIANIDNDLFFLSKKAVESFSNRMLAVPPPSEEIESLIWEVGGAKKITSQILETLNFVGKVAGSTTENPHKLYKLESTSAEPAPTDFTEEASQADYDAIEADDASNAVKTTTPSVGADTSVSITLDSVYQLTDAANWFDGDTTTYNTANDGLPSGTHWAIGDLGSIQPINKVGIYGHSNATNQTLQKLEISTDKNNWTTVLTNWTYGAGALNWTTFSIINARYVKWYWDAGKPIISEAQIRLVGDYYPDPEYAHWLAEWDTSAYSVSDIQKLIQRIIGFGSGAAGNGLTCKIRNFTDNLWYLVGSNEASSPSTIYQEITSNISKYIDGSSKIKVMMSSTNPSSSPAATTHASASINLVDEGIYYNKITSVAQVAASHFKTAYLLSTFGGNADKLFSFDYLRADWLIHKGLNASCFCNWSGEDDKGELYFGDARVGYVYQFGVGTDDAGLPIDSFFESKTSALGSLRKKLIKELFLIAKGNGTLLVDIYTYWDAEGQALASHKQIPITLSTGEAVTYREKVNLRGRAAKIKFSNEALNESFWVYPPVALSFLEIR